MICASVEMGVTDSQGRAFDLPQVNDQQEGGLWTTLPVNQKPNTFAANGMTAPPSHIIASRIPAIRVWWDNAALHC